MSRAIPNVLLWALGTFLVLCEIVPVVLRDCASMTWTG